MASASVRPSSGPENRAAAPASDVSRSIQQVTPCGYVRGIRSTTASSSFRPGPEPGLGRPSPPRSNAPGRIPWSVPIAHHRSTAAAMDPVVLYRLLELRNAVFVVEQRAAYDDLDGRDVEPGAELLWTEEDGAVLSTLRVLREPEALRIGRVATTAAARSRGVASALMRLAIARCRELDPALPVLLGAQEHLAGWYARFGFAVDGPGYAEDGIPHVPMRLPAG